MSKVDKIPLEVEEHLLVAEWLNKHGVFFIHIPNEGQRTIGQAVLLKRMGLKKGAPDFIIPGPVVNIAMELKRCRKVGKSGKLVTPSRVSKEQNEVLWFLAQCHWKTQVCYGAAEAIGWLQTLDLHKKPLKSIAVLEG